MQGLAYVYPSGDIRQGGTMTYTYLGDGTKIAARVGTSPRGVSGLAGKRYRG